MSNVHEFKTKQQKEESLSQQQNKIREQQREIEQLQMIRMEKQIDLMKLRRQIDESMVSEVEDLEEETYKVTRNEDGEFEVEIKE